MKGQMNEFREKSWNALGNSHVFYGAYNVKSLSRKSSHEV